MSLAAPYPPDTRAKGWRFELDMERFKESDTWIRARDACTRGLLLLLWAEAWGRRPAGSLPNDDELIAGILGVADEEFAARRHVLMRGWWLADDGLLYHDVLVERVREMMTKRKSDSDRQALKRERAKAKAAEAAPEPAEVTTGSRRDHADVTRDTGATHAEVRPESDTRTRTRTEIQEQSAPPAPRVRAREGPVDNSDEHPPDDPRLLEVVRSVRQAGYPDVSAADPVLRSLMAQGLTADEAVAAAKAGIDAGRGWGWVVARIRGRRQDAAALALPAKAVASVATATPDAERTQALLASMQLTPEEREASAAAKRKLWESRRAGARGATT